MVGRRKHEKDKWLPPRVYRGKSRYEYRPKGGGTVNLCKLPADRNETEAVKAEVWRLYSIEKEAPPKRDDVDELIKQFHLSPQFAQLGTRTKQDYERYSKKISAVFGQMLPHEVMPVHVRQFMDAMGKKINANGEAMTTTANRHHSYLSVLFAYGLQYNWIEDNPAKKVRKFREKPRDRYIEDWEFEMVLNAARNSSYAYIAPMMEIAYLCRARRSEVLNLTEADCLEYGLFIDRTKGSQNEITAWSPRLSAAVEEAKNLFECRIASISRPIVRGRNGMAIRPEAFKTAWQRVMRVAKADGLKESFTFHDIKAKGVTDHKKKASGHKSKKMQAVYDRKPGVVDPTR